jgi:hypothetical protein
MQKAPTSWTAVMEISWPKGIRVTLYPVHFFTGGQLNTRFFAKAEELKPLMKLFFAESLSDFGHSYIAGFD